jgi:hypothetical protein
MDNKIELVAILWSWGAEETETIYEWQQLSRNVCDILLNRDKWIKKESKISGKDLS